MCRFTLPVFLLALTGLAYGQAPCRVPHLAIFDANLAEFMEQRTLDLQAGANTVEWRSLMPQAYVRTIRVSGDGVTVVRQDVTYDGPDAKGQKAPVLHLVLHSAGAAGPHKVQVDYLAPNLSWKGDYAMILAASVNEGPPTEALLDGWVTVQNDTGTDVCADTVDLVAGEVQLLLGGGRPVNYQIAAQQTANFSAGTAGADSAGDSFAEVSGVSVFSRLRLARNVSMTANAAIDRFPLFQRLKLPVEERHIFENDARTQTLGRGGFTLLPRGLEVRLVSKNSSPSPLPAGTVTVYTMDGEVPQVVGQDRIPLTPVGADFSVSQGRSTVLQGTRRVADRREVPEPYAANGRKLVTSVEVVVSNRGPVASTAFVREGVESWGSSQWSVTKSSHPQQKLGDHAMEFKLSVPPAGSVKVEYTVETK
jgi:hypothetical protein